MGNPFKKESTTQKAIKVANKAAMYVGYGTFIMAGVGAIFTTIDKIVEVKKAKAEAKLEPAVEQVAE